MAGLSPRVQLPPIPVRGNGRSDPPSQTSARSFYTIDNKVPSPEALLYAIQLMRGIEDTLDEYICGNAGEPGIGMLVNSVHNVQMSRALAELVLAREP